MIGETFTSLPLGQIFAQRKEQGRECLPVYAVTMQGLINRREFARRVESDLSSNRHALVCEGDVVYNTMRLWQGVADVASEDCNVSPAYIVCKPRVPVWPRYFAHAFKTPEMVAKFKSKSEGVASDRFRLYFHQFAKIELNLPPLQEQRRIAEILDTVDEALRKTEQVIAKLEQVKAGLLHDLLTRGIDENGELRDPEKRPQDFKESELGLIPKGWEVEPLRAVTLRVDYGVSVPLHDSGEVPVLRMNNFSAGEATIDDLRFSDSPKAKNLLLRDGDVLFNRTNSIEHVGRTAFGVGSFQLHLSRPISFGLFPIANM
jgi:hypothetical protein